MKERSKLVTERLNNMLNIRCNEI